MMRIIPLPADDVSAVQQAASLLVVAFREHWPNAWPDMEAALEEVHECLEAENVCLAALDDDGRVLGWIGARPAYGVTGWELHPLVVDPEQQGQGVGGALVRELEAQVRERGGVTLFLGSDDEDGMTSLAGINLVPMRSGTDVVAPDAVFWDPTTSDASGDDLSDHLVNLPERIVRRITGFSTNLG